LFTTGDTEACGANHARLRPVQGAALVRSETAFGGGVWGSYRFSFPPTFPVSPVVKLLPAEELLRTRYPRGDFAEQPESAD